MDAVSDKVLPPARRRPVDILSPRWKEIVFPHEVQEDILSGIYRFHYLLLSQLAAYLNKKSPDFLQRKHIKPLVRAGLLSEQCLSRKTRLGSLPSVYSLATKGKRYLEDLGLKVEGVSSPAEQEKGIGYLTHTLELNNILLLPHLLSRTYPHMSLIEWRHDLDMQHKRTRLPDLKGKRRYIVPDGWWDFSVDKPFSTPTTTRLSFVIELDRGMMHVWHFREKIRDYCDFVYGAYQRDFGSNSLTILWVTTAGEHRAAWMRNQTLVELQSLGKMEHARFHRFLTVPPLFSQGISPETFFLAPVWQTLTNDTRMPLIRPLE